MAKERLEKRFQNHPLSFNNIGCIPYAIEKDGRTLDEILQDIKKEKEIENEVLSLYKKNYHYSTIAKKMNLTQGKVEHIIKFDNLGLSYRKINH